MKTPYLFALVSLLALPVAAQEQPHLLGIGIQRDAAYLGAEKEKYLPVPLINWQAGRFFARSGKGLVESGLHWQLGNGFALGPQLAVELGRNSDDSALLQQLQMPDITYGGSLGLHAEHSSFIGPAPISSLLRLRQRSGSGRGALLDLRVEVGVFATGTLGLQTYIQATWANQQAMESDFAIKTQNAAYANIPAYAPEAGARDLVLGLAGKLDLDKNWLLVFALERKQLHGHAAASPLSEQKNCNIFTLGTIYRFD